MYAGRNRGETRNPGTIYMNNYGEIDVGHLRPVLVGESYTRRLQNLIGTITKSGVHFNAVVVQLFGRIQDILCPVLTRLYLGKLEDELAKLPFKEEGTL